MPGTVIIPCKECHDQDQPRGQEELADGRIHAASKSDLEQKLLGQDLPWLIYQVAPGTIEAAGPWGSISSPDPVEGRRARMELNFQASHFTAVKSLRAPENSFTPVLRSKQEKSLVAEPEHLRHMQLNPCLQLELNSAIMASGKRTFSPLIHKCQKAI